MAAAVERIVVQATAQEKQAIASKAKRLGLPISELMRRGASAYEGDDADEADDALANLADTARSAAERAGASIDDALDFIAASNARIAALEARAAAPAAAAAAAAPKRSTTASRTATRRLGAPARKAA